MNFRKLTVLFLVFVLICTVGASRRRGGSGTLSDSTDECTFAKEVCDYAWEMQQEFDAMPDTTDELREERRNFMNALNSVISHCERARRECQRSVR